MQRWPNNSPALGQRLIFSRWGKQLSKQCHPKHPGNWCLPRPQTQRQGNSTLLLHCRDALHARVVIRSSRWSL